MELKPDRQAASVNVSPLLIVPYGIETALLHLYGSLCNTFNRTLWN